MISAGSHRRERADGGDDGPPQLASAAALADAGVPVPDALLALSSDLLNEERDRFGDRAVYKTAIGTHGGGTWMVDRKTGQRTGRWPLRVLTGVHGARRAAPPRPSACTSSVTDRRRDDRYAPEGEWRTNVALGGEVEDRRVNSPSESGKLRSIRSTPSGWITPASTSSRAMTATTCSK